jgi:hypothetical protein
LVVLCYVVLCYGSWMDCLQVRADLDALCATFKTAVPEDIDDRAETLELFLAEQNLRAMTVYDEAPTKNMFKMGMKVMHKDLKELVSTTILYCIAYAMLCYAMLCYATVPVQYSTRCQPIKPALSRCCLGLPTLTQLVWCGGNTAFRLPPGAGALVGDIAQLNLAHLAYKLGGHPRHVASSRTLVRRG